MGNAGRQRAGESSVWESRESRTRHAKRLSMKMKQGGEYLPRFREQRLAIMKKMKETTLTLVVDQNGERLDTYLSEQREELTRSHVKKLIASGRVLVDGQVKKAGCKLKAGSVVDITFQPEQEADIVKEDLPLNIVYEDKWLAVINKPRGMVVHPAPGNPSGTLVNALMYHIKDLSGINGVVRPGIVHRIDKDTTGLLVVAKNDAAHLRLAEEIQQRQAHRTYLALVYGNIRQDQGSVDAPIGRHKKDRKKMAVVPDGRSAITHYKVLRRYGGRYTLVKADLETGRTHQIRVHFAHMGHSVVADPVYSAGRDTFGVSGQLLHAYCLKLIHPATGEPMSFYAALPEDFLQVLHKLHRQFPGTNG